MGYSHSWYVEETDPGWHVGFAGLVDDARRILAHERHHVRDLVCDADVIRFNPARGFGETFYLPRRNPAPFLPPRIGYDGAGNLVTVPGPERRPFWFCKTNRLAYDTAVTAVLLRAVHHLGEAIWVSSDGTWDDWFNAETLVVELFDTGATNPIRDWPLGADKPSPPGRPRQQERTHGR